MPEPFANRRDAGVVLAAHLRGYGGRTDLVVLGLPRGGVPVAYEVAKALDAPFDIFLVRKLGLPGHPELAMGAIASGGIRVLNDEVVRAHDVSAAVIEVVAAKELAELERREREYGKGAGHADPLGRPEGRPLQGQVVVLVDDGLATGSTMRAAVEAVRRLAPARVVVAVPVGSRSASAQIALVADETVCAMTPDTFSAVGQWYRDFSQTTDEEVRALIAEHAARRRATAADARLEGPHDLVDPHQQTVRPTDPVR